MKVLIKPHHQDLVTRLMEALGGVSATDAIGYLLQCSGKAALERLNPTVSNSVQSMPTQKLLQPQQSGQTVQKESISVTEGTAKDAFDQLGI